MISIPPLNTRRLSIRMRELPISAAIRLAGIPMRSHEHAVTELLNSVLERAERPTDAHVTDPREWTVQERTLALCHYLAATGEEADFRVGEGRFSDYFDPEADYPKGDVVDLGEACGDSWRAVPLTGAMAEAIERLDGAVHGVAAGRAHWIFGCLAAQLRRHAEAEDSVPGYADASGLDDWLSDRMAVFAGFPESDFMALLLMHAQAQQSLRHLFDIDVGVTDIETGLAGLLAFPKGGGGAALPPARFPVGECIGGVAKGIAGKLRGNG